MTVTTSVVVPVYNDPEGVRTTVASLLEQGSEDYEVVIADNGSTDETTPVAREFAANDRVTYVREDAVQSSYAARNAGIDAAAGDVIGFLDADMWVEDDYVAAITAAVRDDGHSYVGCDVELVADGGSIARYRRATGFPVEAYVCEDRFAPTCCLVVDRDLFDAIGTFDDRLTSAGDVEFGRRAHDAGVTLAYEPSITLYHPARATLSAVLAQNHRIGGGRAELRRYHPDRFAVRSALDPRRYLPVHPSRFSEDLSADPRNGGEFVGWYAVACLQKWSRTGGYLHGRLAGAT